MNLVQMILKNFEFSPSIIFKINRNNPKARVSIRQFQPAGNEMIISDGFKLPELIKNQQPELV